jgi:ribosome-associated protein
MDALQTLGEELLALDAARLAKLDLPERLVDALVAARGITAHEGRRRQLQYVGKLMRDVDPGPIRAALDQWHAPQAAQAAHYAAMERWRDRLLADDAALAEFIAAHPACDAKALGRAVADARAEAGRAGPPHAFRALFRAIRKASDVPA